MADLLTHVLVPYILLTVASWWIDWITKRWIVIAMVGTAIPDLDRIDIVIDSTLIERTFDIPFTYAPISSLGGVLVIAAAIALFFDRKRRSAYAYLVFGGFTALVGDALRMYADGHSDFLLYPFLWWRPPTPNLYVTSDPRVPIVTIALSGLVFVADRYIIDL